MGVRGGTPVGVWGAQPPQPRQGLLGLGAKPLGPEGSCFWSEAPHISAPIA